MNSVTVQIVETSLDGSCPVLYEVHHVRGGRSCTVQRRYSALHAMKEALRAKKAKLPLTPFPPKRCNSVLGPCSRGMLRKRRGGLQLYLCALSELQESWDSPAVKSVLCSVEDRTAGHAGEQASSVPNQARTTEGALATPTKMFPEGGEKVPGSTPFFSTPEGYSEPPILVPGDVMPQAMPSHSEVEPMGPFGPPFETIGDEASLALETLIENKTKVVGLAMAQIEEVDAPTAKKVEEPPVKETQAPAVEEAAAEGTEERAAEEAEPPMAEKVGAPMTEGAGEMPAEETEAPTPEEVAVPTAEETEETKSPTVEATETPSVEEAALQATEARLLPAEETETAPAEEIKGLPAEETGKAEAPSSIEAEDLPAEETEEVKAPPIIEAKATPVEEAYVPPTDGAEAPPVGEAKAAPAEEIETPTTVEAEAPSTDWTGVPPAEEVDPPSAVDPAEEIEEVLAQPTDGAEELPAEEADAPPTVETDVPPAEEADAPSTVETEESPAEEVDTSPAVEAEVSPAEEADASPTVETDAPPAGELEEAVAQATVEVEALPAEEADLPSTVDAEATPAEEIEEAVAQSTDRTEALPAEEADLPPTVEAEAAPVNHNGAPPVEDGDILPTEEVVALPEPENATPPSEMKALSAQDIGTSPTEEADEAHEKGAEAPPAEQAEASLEEHAETKTERTQEEAAGVTHRPQEVSSAGEGVVPTVLKMDIPPVTLEVPVEPRIVTLPSFDVDQACPPILSTPAVGGAKDVWDTKAVMKLGAAPQEVEDDGGVSAPKADIKLELPAAIRHLSTNDGSEEASGKGDAPGEAVGEAHTQPETAENGSTSEQTLGAISTLKSHLPEGGDAKGSSGQGETEQATPAKRKSLFRRAARSSKMTSDKPGTVPFNDLDSPSGGSSVNPRRSSSGRLSSLRNRARNFTKRLSGGGGSGPLSAPSLKSRGKGFFSMATSSAEENGGADVKDEDGAAPPSTSSIPLVDTVALGGDRSIAVGGQDGAGTVPSPPSPGGGN